jgi:adenylate cyclase
VVEGTVAPQAVRGMIVLVGSSATGLMDLRSTPLDPAVPGVEVHAQLMEQIINQQWLLRPRWADGAELLFLAVLGLAVIVLSARLGAILAAAAGGVGLVLAGGLSWYAFAEAQLLLDPVFPNLTVGAVYLTSSLVRHVQAEKQRKFVEHAFSSYLSPNLVQYFIDNPDELRLGGERRECSFVLTDLADFTSLVEGSDPASLVSVLNDYIEGMTTIVFEHEGTLDRIVGDAVAVLFSAPIVQADHAERAVACALAMDRFAQNFARAKRAQGIPLGHTRIGVNTGPVVIGNIGGKAHSDYRALGDAINTAARLETANRHLGTRILVSGATVARCASFTGRPVGTLMFKGKTTGVEAYVPYSVDGAASTTVADYAEAFALLDGDGDDAAAAFADLARRHPEDPLVAFHLARLRNGQRGSLVVLADK